jgi:mannose-1-phosphate guanylyltransferase/phosphomannomutase
MKALLIATGYREEMAPLLQDRPIPLLKVVDKPLLIHIVESLYHQGIEEVTIVVSYLPERIENLLGDGSRWGLSIKYFRLQDYKGTVGELFPPLRTFQDDIFLISSADILPFFQLGKLIHQYEEFKTPIFLNSSSHEWTGWGLIPLKDFLDLSESTPLDHLPIKNRIVWAHSFLSVRSYADLQKANEKLLSGKKDETFRFPASAKMIQPEVWISHGSSMSSSVKLRPPVYIGENCQIKAGVQLGPNTVIESNCVVDTKTVVEKSIICRGSYVGEELIIRNCIVDKNLLINLHLNTHTIIKDDVLIGELSSGSLWKNFWFDLKKLFKGV